MTIPRVLMAAAILVLGFMIWGVHRDLWQLKTNLEAGSGELLRTVTAISQSMVVTHQKLDANQSTLDAAKDRLDKLKPTGTVRIGKPRVRPVPHLRPRQLEFWPRLFSSPPSQTEYSPG